MRARGGVRRGFERLSDRLGGGGVDVMSLIVISEVYLTSPGSSSITPPAGALVAFAQIVGGGAAWAGGNAAGSGGGAGAEETFLVSGNLPYVIGSAGVSSTKAGDTTLTTPIRTIVAEGGYPNVSGTPGIGGRASVSVGTRTYNGGSGTTGTTGNNGAGVRGGKGGIVPPGGEGAGGGGGGPLGGDGGNTIASLAPVRGGGGSRGGGAPAQGSSGAIFITFYGLP